MPVHRLQRPSAMRLRREAGFTLLELLAAVAIIGILAAVAVMAYNKYIRKAKSTEVAEMFGKFKIGEESFNTENGSYLSTAAEGTYWPTPLKGDSRTDISAVALPGPWRQLRMQPGSGLYCQYNVVAGPANDTTTMGVLGTSMYAGLTPTKNWFYLLAQCDWNNKPADFTRYSQRGDQGGIAIEGEGK